MDPHSQERGPSDRKMISTHASIHGGREGFVSESDPDLEFLGMYACRHALDFGKLLWYGRKVAKQQRRLTEQRNASEGGKQKNLRMK